MNNTNLDQDLAELMPNATTGAHEVRNKAIGQASVLNIQATRDLNKTIKTLDNNNSQLTTKVYYLTIATVVLAAIQILPIIWGIIKFIYSLFT